jgi:hypothetical protein
MTKKEALAGVRKAQNLDERSIQRALTVALEHCDPPDVARELDLTGDELMERYPSIVKNAATVSSVRAPMQSARVVDIYVN